VTKYPSTSSDHECVWKEQWRQANAELCAEEAENAILRTALEAIVAKGPASPGDTKCDIAREALKELK
jgi:hypothetical protein